MGFLNCFFQYELVYQINQTVLCYTRERKHFPHLHGLFAVMLRQAWPYVPLRVRGGQSFLALR